MNGDNTFAVIVPTFHRPECLTRCLIAVIGQDLQPARVVVAIKQGDEESVRAAELVRELSGGDIVELAVAPASANVIGQQNVALAATREDFVALTDDDAEPHPDWLGKIYPHFENPQIAGVGGRDWQPYERSDKKDVGKISWFGRGIGNHHLGSGPPRDVDVLKGVNCCFRGDLLRTLEFDPRMRGPGTVIHWEMSLCLSLRRAGWRLIYDPAIAVEHHVAARQDGDINSRGGFEASSFSDAIHNETLSLLEYLPPINRAAFLIWAFAVGTSSSPGVAQMPRLLCRRSPNMLSRWRATLRGRVEGVRSYLVGRQSMTRSTNALSPHQSASKTEAA